MFEVLLSEINEKVNLSEVDQESIKVFFSPKKLRKRQYLLQVGDHCKYLIFVEKGALRSYSIDDKGNEHIMQFAMEGWWIADNNSFFTGASSVYNIDALEDSEVLQLSLPAYEEMIAHVPKMERYFRILMQNRLVAMQRRITVSLTYTVEQKYLRLLEVYPDIFNRFSQHLIASYLGTTPETLSRIRKQISLKK